MANRCPKCGQTNRPGAKFCAVCGAALAMSTGGTASAGGGPSQASLGPALAQAGAALAPVAKQMAAKGWVSSKRGMSLLARVFTVGGRAAYTELFRPLPAGGGQVVAAPTEATVPAPVEPAALIFVLALLAGWLVFALPATPRAIIIIGLPIVLLVLSWLGVRRPYFTALTFTGLLGWLRNRGRAPQVPLYRFPVAERAAGRQVDVVMIGPRRGNSPTAGATVELWGIYHVGRNELRAWRVASTDASGQTVGILAAPRLIPLVVALFLPALLWLVAWVLTLLL
jgi:hypothetical protein